MLFFNWHERISETFDKIDERFKEIKESINNLWSNYSRNFDDIYKEIDKLNKKVDMLFTKDDYDTLRPKVDIQADDRNREHESIWAYMGKLSDRIDKLEKK